MVTIDKSEISSVLFIFVAPSRSLDVNLRDKVQYGLLIAKVAGTRGIVDVNYNVLGACNSFQGHEYMLWAIGPTSCLTWLWSSTLVNCECRGYVV